MTNSRFSDADPLSGSASSFTPDPEKLAALAEFAAGAGHEINNPLGTILGRAQQLLRDEHDPQRQQLLAIIAAQAYRIRDMIGDLMVFARPPAPEPEEVDAAELTRATLAKLQEHLAAKRCRVKLTSAELVECVVDPVQWSILVSELVRNAAEALQPNGGEIPVELSDGADTLELVVRDAGRGFSETERRHAFDPFFSGRQAGRGLGFGLCKVWQIVRMHHGEITIDSAAGETAVRVRLPREFFGDLDAGTEDEGSP